MKQTQSLSPKGGRSEPNWLWNLKDKKKSLEFISKQVMKTWLTAEINRIHSLQHDIHSMRDTIQNCSKYNKIRKMRSLNKQSEWGRGRRGKLWYSTLVSLPIRSGSMRPSHSILNFHSLHTFQWQEPFYFSPHHAYLLIYLARLTFVTRAHHFCLLSLQVLNSFRLHKELFQNVPVPQTGCRSSAKGGDLLASICSW